MASLALSLVGSAFGGPIGGAIGGALGGMIDNVLFPAPKPPPPKITASTYGVAIPRAWGSLVRLGCNMIWTSGWRKASGKSAKLASKKGLPPAYVCDLAFLVGNGPWDPSWCRKIFANGNTLFDASIATSEPTPDAQGVVTWDLSHQSHKNFDTLTVYPGNFTQLPDPTIEAAKGVGNTPAYRGRTLIVITALQGTPWGNSVPTLNVMCRPQSAGIGLATVVLDICTRAGLDTSRISTSSLAGTIQGYAVTSQSDCYSAIQPLGLVYAFDAAEVAGALRFIPRGQPPVCTIINDVLGGHAAGQPVPDAFSWPDAPEITLPQVAALTFNDPDRDCNQNTQSAKRDTGSAQSNISTTVEVTLTSDQGRRVCDRMLWEPQIGRNSVKASTDDRLIWLESARTFAIEVPFGYEQIRVTKRSRGMNGVIDFEAKRDSVSIYESIAGGQGAAALANPLLIGGPVNPPIFVEPPSTFPGLSQPTLFIGLSGGDGTTANPAWSGCQVWVSTDDVTGDYQLAGVAVAPACMGKTTAILPSYGGSNPDTGHTLAVDTSMSDGEPSAISSTDAAHALIPYYVGGEYLSAQTVTDLGAFLFHLTNLWRGLYGSSKSTHASGAAFLRLDQACFRYPIPPAYVGQELFFRFVGDGETLASVPSYTYTPGGGGFGTGAGGVPAAPSAPTPTGGSGNVALGGTPNIPEDNVTSYTVYRATGASQPFSAATAIATNVEPGWTDSTASFGVTYTYFYVANNAVGSSLPSAGANGTPGSGAPGQAGATFSAQDISTKPLSTVIARYPAPYAWTLPATTSTPAGFAEGRVDTAPGSDTDFDLLKDGVSVGTLRFAAGSHTPTLIKAADTAFVLTDYLDLKTPASLNGMAGAFGVALVGTK